MGEGWGSGEERKVKYKEEKVKKKKVTAASLQGAFIAFFSLLSEGHVAISLVVPSSSYGSMLCVCGECPAGNVCSGGNDLTL